MKTVCVLFALLGSSMAWPGGAPSNWCTHDEVPDHGAEAGATINARRAGIRRTSTGLMVTAPIKGILIVPVNPTDRLSFDSDNFKELDDGCDYAITHTNANSKMGAKFEFLQENTGDIKVIVVKKKEKYSDFIVL